MPIFYPDFRALCDKFDFKPTYLTNYEMATCKSFQKFGRETLAYDTGEIGMHLHAWNSPPITPLTANDLLNHPYLTEYPEGLMRDKIRVMTELLEQVFQIKVYRPSRGRWALNEVYAQILVDKGYHVDCSVTPFLSWKTHIGDPNKEGGTNYTGFPDKAYLVNLDCIKIPGVSALLEIPMTIAKMEGNRLMKKDWKCRQSQRVNNTRDKTFISINMLVPTQAQ